MDAGAAPTWAARGSGEPSETVGAGRLRALRVLPDPAPGGPVRPEPAAPPLPGGQPTGDRWQAVQESLPALIGEVTDRFGLGRLLLVVALLVAALGLGAGWLIGRHERASVSAIAQPTQQQLPDLGSSSAAAPSVAGDTAASIVVDVAGRVRHPGLVTLPTGARVADAISAAGGLRPGFRATGLDLAAKVGDGQLLQIGSAPADASAPDGSLAGAQPGADPGAATGAGPGVGAAPIDLNTATAAELETLPGIGPVLAQRIVDYVAQNGGFTSVQQLEQVPGIGPSHFQEVEALVTT